MIYHFLPRDVFASQFVGFMRNNKEKIEGDHFFLFLSHNGRCSNNLANSNDSLNVDSFYSIIKVFLSLKKDNRIIIHGYSHPYLYLATALSFWQLKKCGWVIWGGDLVFFTAKKKLKYKCYELFRRFAIPRFGYVITYGYEYELAKKYYHVRGKNINFLYPMIFFDMPQAKSKNGLHILVGNSRSVSNEHIEALSLLSKFKNENIKIFVPLSYGDSQVGYVESIDRFGRETFGAKYIPIKNMMELKKYQEFLSDIDIMVCNHRRQEAWGNLFTILLHRKKVFVRKETPTNIDFNNFGLKFALTDDIPNMTFDKFKDFNLEDGKNNEKVIKNMFSNENLIHIWNNIFKSMLD